MVSGSTTRSIGIARTRFLAKLAVRLSLLEPWSSVPQSLLPAWQKEESLSAACDTICTHYGLFAVTSGLLARGHRLRPEVTGFLGDKQYQFL
ncbi:MAG: hypothetical protein A3J60_00075 [Candidatus Pacebacteria bacterium RIFCSPHIGHO2_02_FULL_46_9]|nr:MAG: hypothetical protein A3J60_00075 [Candidatus Pacebacteria bacterium RIFCSPHIGHO2_02_FULL_46_9]